MKRQPFRAHPPSEFIGLTTCPHQVSNRGALHPHLTVDFAPNRGRNTRRPTHLVQLHPLITSDRIGEQQILITILRYFRPQAEEGKSGPI